MKNQINVQAFSTAAKKKVEQAQVMGSKTTWTTRDHLATLAKVLEANPGTIGALLEDGYNISAWQQTLEKLFEGTGHFQREGKRGRTLDGVLADLAAFAAGDGAKQG